MISEITGEVLYDRIQRHSLLVRVQAISYEIFVPSGIASRLRTCAGIGTAEPADVLYHLLHRWRLGRRAPDAKLVGFLDPLDREFFETFTTVPGVGFMRALKCLIRPLNEIAMAIEGGDTGFLKELPFIGAKTSERIVTELRGKMAKFALARTEEPLSVEQRTRVGVETRGPAGARTARVFARRGVTHGRGNFRQQQEPENHRGVSAKVL